MSPRKRGWSDITVTDQFCGAGGSSIEDDPGLFALLYALVARESAAWEADENQELEAVYLGTVVRAQECRVHPTDLNAEAVDHFAAIMGGKTVEPIEQLLKRLA